MTDYRMNRYIARGVRTDCRVLIEKFCKYHSVRYEHFARVWREMKFSFIYFGRKNFDELLEFTEEALRIAKEFWLDDVSFNEKVGGLYTLYGLYVKQPTGNLVKIRITSSEMLKIAQFRIIIQNELHHDVNYILSKLIALGAFHLCVTTYIHGLEKNIRRYHEADRSSTEKNVLKYPGKVGNKQVLQDLEEALKQYEDLKKKVSMRVEGCRLSLDSSNIVSGIRENLEKLKPSIERPMLSLSADAIRKAKEGRKSLSKGDCGPKTSISGTERLQSQFKLSRKVSSNSSEDENETAGTSKLGKQKKRGHLSDVSMLREEAHTSGRTSLGMTDDSEMESDYENYDHIGNERDLTAEQQMQDQYLLSMPLLWVESSTLQSSDNSSRLITEEGCPQSDDEGRGGIEEKENSEVSDEELLKRALDDNSGSDNDSDSNEQKRNTSESLHDMPVLLM